MIESVKSEKFGFVFGSVLFLLYSIDSCSPSGCLLLGSAVSSTDVKLPSLSSNSHIILDARPLPLPSPPSIVIKYMSIDIPWVVNNRDSSGYLVEL